MKSDAPNDEVEGGAIARVGPAGKRGCLIVSADDFGMNETATDNILVCFRKGAVTSAGAMVFMKDSERAAEKARDEDLDIGLHLNFTQPFECGVDTTTRDRQERIARFLGRGRYASVVYHPRLGPCFKNNYRDQYDEFARLYGRAPTHVNGHHHMHLCSNMLLAGIVPKGQAVRRSFSFASGDKSALNRMYRAFVDRIVMTRYRTTDYLFSLADCLSRGRMERAVELAGRCAVELETHPENAGEMEWLLGRCAETFSGVKRVGYSDLFLRVKNTADPLVGDGME